MSRQLFEESDWALSGKEALTNMYMTSDDESMAEETKRESSTAVGSSSMGVDPDTFEKECVAVQFKQRG